VHSLRSGTWGPRCGWLVQVRGKDGRDFRQRLLRSLAVLVTGERKEIPTTIAIPRFIRYQPRDDGAKGLEEEDSPD